MIVVSIGKWDEDTTNDTAGIWFSSASSHAYNITQHTPHIYSFKSTWMTLLAFTSYGGHEFKYIENADTGRRNHNGTDTVAMKITNTAESVSVSAISTISITYLWGSTIGYTARAITKNTHLEWKII